MLFKHKTKSHTVRLVDTPLEHTDNTSDEQVDGLLKYAYCQRQKLDIQSPYGDDPSFKPFLMEWDRFCKLYEGIN